MEPTMATKAADLVQKEGRGGQAHDILGSDKSTRLLDAKWCRPKIAVRVKHLAGSKSLRHATVRGLAS